MSTTTAAPTINVSAEERDVIFKQAYFLAMGGLAGSFDFDVYQFDPGEKKSLRVHLDWLEEPYRDVSCWIKLLRQLVEEEDVLVVEPSWFDAKMRHAIEGLRDPSVDEGNDEDTKARFRRDMDVLRGLAERLEGAPVEVPA